MGALSLHVTIACVGERGPSRATSATPGAPASTPTADAAAFSAADSGVADGSKAEPADAGAPAHDAEPDKPFVLKGARRCTGEELQSEVCAEGKNQGSCLDGWCVTEARCDRYCSDKAAYDMADCVMDPKGCEGIAECLRTAKEVNRNCQQTRAQLYENCRFVTCALIRSLQRP